MTAKIIEIIQSKGFSICPSCEGSGEVSYFCGHYTTIDCPHCMGAGVKKHLSIANHTNMNTLNQITVKSLRQNGWKVQVGHYRIAMTNFPKLNFGLNLESKEFRDNCDNGGIICFRMPKGGKTTVKITKDGIDGFGEALCHPEDNYNRKTGVGIAIKKAFQNWHKNKKINSAQEQFKSGWKSLGSVMEEEMDITNEIPAGFGIKE